MDNEQSSTRSEQLSWMWQKLSAWIPGLSARDSKNDEKAEQLQEDKKDNHQFKPVKMCTLYNCNEKELPNFVTIKQFGQTFYEFVSRRGDKVDQELTVHDCFKIAGLVSKREGKQAGLIEIQSLTRENFVWIVEMVRKYRHDSPLVTIDKKDAIYSWLGKSQVLIDYRTKREYLVLKEDDSSYYTLNIPVLMVTLAPHLKDGEKLNTQKFKPIHKAYFDSSIDIKNEPHVGNDATYWPFEWQQLNRIDLILFLVGFGTRVLLEMHFSKVEK